MRITYRPEGFSGSNQRLHAGNRILTFSPADLVRAVVTVGRENVTDVLQFGDLSELEIVWRTALLLASVQERTDGFLEWTPAYHALDPSERGAVSYFVGMTFAKLMSEQLLNVPWLLHLDVYQSILAPGFQAGDQRPDLVGRTVDGRWVALEAKGGAGNLKARGWARARGQLANLRSVHGVPVAQRVTSVTFQRRRRQCPCLHVEFRDPPAKVGGFDLNVSPTRFISDYYEHLLKIVGDDATILPDIESVSGSPFIGRYIREVDFSVGIAAEVFRTRAEAAMGYAAAALEVQRDPGIPERASGLASAGMDGVAVVLGPSWAKRLVSRSLLRRGSA